MKMQMWCRVWFVAMGIMVLLLCFGVTAYGEDAEPPTPQAPPSQEGESPAQEQEEEPELDHFFLWVRERNIGVYQRLVQLRNDVRTTETDTDKEHEQMRRYQNAADALSNLLTQLSGFPGILADMRRLGCITAAHEMLLLEWHERVTEAWAEFRRQVLARNAAAITAKLGIEERYVDVAHDDPVGIDMPVPPDRKNVIASRHGTRLYDAILSIQEQLQETVLRYNTKLEEQKRLWAEGEEAGSNGEGRQGESAPQGEGEPSSK